ncbi:MAG: RnfABCDGE type electron transport complex subunit D [Pseudomonadales bacterium]|nr:RnfABCDGE type electron transport complex subunit D [Pseudomonadales bacterium]
MLSATKGRNHRTSQKVTEAGKSSGGDSPGSGITHPHLLKVPGLFILGLFLLSFTPRVQGHPVLIYSFWAACAFLAVWQFLLLRRYSSQALSKSFVISLRPQHYIQAMVHLSVYFYWGMNWQPVQAHVVLLIAQLLFAYAFDIMLSWSRRDTYQLGFGPFPIIFSTNLFLWFHDDWFYLQFLMIAIGFLGKEFVRWNRDGRLVHIFNPSAFTLGLFSIVLITTNTTDLTWGPQIASTLSLAPGIYTYLFLGGLVVMYFFSITLVAASSAMVLFGLSALYYSITGVPYFLDSEIPTAVFLGLHLLVTDPSTSPRTPTGRLVFGILYGLGVFVLYTLLSMAGAPTFYDKLLCVPLLNLSVQWIDRLVAPLRNHPMLERWGVGVTPSRKANLVHMGIWIVFFAWMSALGKTDSRHVGDSLPFWEEACEMGKPNACNRLLLLESTYCNDNSGWACNAIGAQYHSGEHVEQDTERAMGFFARACELRFQAGCLNYLDSSTIRLADPRAFDLRLLLREGGENLLDMPEPELYQRACEHGWTYACGM